jgi:hypothetical protein
MISVAFDHVCSRLVAAYRWSIVGHYCCGVLSVLEMTTTGQQRQTWSNLCERSWLYVASWAFRLATFVLWITRRLYRARLLTFSDLRYALRVGETLRRLGSRLLRWKHR